MSGFDGRVTAEQYVARVLENLKRYDDAICWRIDRPKPSPHRMSALEAMYRIAKKKYDFIMLDENAVWTDGGKEDGDD